MEILGSLGIDVKILIAQIINFGLLLWILSKFMYKPILKRIEEDENDLESVRTQKTSLEEDLKIFTEKKESDIKETKNRARKIIKEAEEVASDIKDQAMKDTERDKQQTIKQLKSRLRE